MKLSEFKKAIKASVKEAIQEELKDILLESIKTNNKPSINESSPQPSKPQASTEEKEQFREKYKNFLAGDQPQHKEANSGGQPSQPVRVTSTNTASEGASLPEGEMPLDQISNFLPKK